MYLTHLHRWDRYCPPPSFRQGNDLVVYVVKRIRREGKTKKMEKREHKRRKENEMGIIE